jgi:prephenate dehydrogenase
VRVLIVGTGLIGTSIGLALRNRDFDGEVWLTDSSPASARLAADMGAGTVWPADAGPAELAVLAVPPEAVAATLADAQARGLARFYTDVASVKQLPVTQARAHGCDMSAYVPGHPLAGREKHGPAAARADLFLGRTWAFCTSPETSGEAAACVVALIEACGAVPVNTDPVTHDRWVALVSHAPHVVAAAMAARLEPGRALDLAGQGLRDVTRIAAGDTGLWTQILTANAIPVSEVLAEVAADLAAAAAALAEGEPKPVTDLLHRGQAGVARIPGKHGGAQRSFAVIQVVISDRPGELARLFNAAGAAGVNIEDIRIEHSPGLPVGVAELAIPPADVSALLDALQAGGWPVKAHLFGTAGGAVGARPGVPLPGRIPAEEPQREQHGACRPAGQHREVVDGHDGAAWVLKYPGRGVDDRLNRQVGDRPGEPVRQFGGERAKRA